MNLQKTTDTKTGTEKPEETANRRCLYCGQIAGLVWVHGHGQCAACGINTDECCRGESCEWDFNAE